MAVAFAELQGVLRYISTHLDGDVSLEALAAQAGISRFHLHRQFSGATGETPKRISARLRLGRAAVLLLTTDLSVLNIALAAGFQSHETFCRAFHRRFQMAPSAYRKRGFAPKIDTAQQSAHAAIVEKVAACVGLYRMSQKSNPRGDRMTYSVVRKEIAPQPVLVVRRRVPRTAIAATIGEALPHVFVYAQQHGIALAGLPFTRYVEMSPGLVTMEPGMRIAGAAPVGLPGNEAVVADTLPGGPAASTVHTGPYETLPDAYAAIQQWIEQQGLTPASAPWEVYLTDPAENPDPGQWKTEIFWPLS